MLEFMKANKKFKGRGGISQYVKTIKHNRSIKKNERRENRLDHNKIGLPKSKTGFLFIYKADITDKDVDFHKLQQLKLVPTLSIFSATNNKQKIDAILNERNAWDFSSEIKYLKYKFVKIEQLNEVITKIRRNVFWNIEFNATDKTYTCFTTYNRLKYLHQLYGVKVLAFTNKLSKKDYLLKDIRDYNKLINRGRVIVKSPFLRKQCLALKASQGHKTEFIYDVRLVPKIVTSKGIKRKKIIEGKPNHSFEHNPELQRLVCITDGTTVKRLKYYEAKKIVDKHPSMTFCPKSEYTHYMNEIHNHVPKEMRHLVRTESVQGSKEDPKDTRVRKDRRLILQKRRLNSRVLYKQYIHAKWIPDENDPNYEVLDKPGKTIISKKRKAYQHMARLAHTVTRTNKKRLMDKYKEVFATEERRGDRFNPTETWSTQFMIALNMVKMKKSKKEIALYLSTIFPGWNDKKLNRFITYLRLTKHGLNYEPNKKRNHLKLTEIKEREVMGIKISKLPYAQPITIEYNKTDSEGNDTTVLEKNVMSIQKKIVRMDEETKEIVVVCTPKDIIRWVPDEKYTDKDDCPWTKFVDIVPTTKYELVKIEYHLPKRKLKKKKWRHPISQNECESKHLPF